jgi:DNA-binding NarL/FixJ family response regulator
MKKEYSIIEKHKEEQLTNRELEILVLISRGLSNQEIGEELYISTKTVKTHLYHIYKKIDVANRVQAALWAKKNTLT